MIAFLAARPLRRRSLSSLVVEHTLRRVGDTWMIVHGPEHTKTKEPLEFPFPETLVADLEFYLAEVRPQFPGADRHGDLWAKLVDAFERNGISFVSVTQQFNTTTSMGRLTLNVLLSFAQFEREVTAERIRDKFRSSRAKGLWMGGNPPLGYDIKDRKLVVNQTEAALVRHIFELFIKIGSATKLVKELNAEGYRTKSWTTQAGRQREGRPLDKGYLYRLLNNRVYLGEAVHKGTSHPGEHDAIVPRDLWDKVHAILAENWRTRANRTRAATPAPLKGLIRCAEHGSAMTPSHTRKKGKQYRYYVCLHAIKNGSDTCAVRSVPAGEIEDAVIAQVRTLLRTPEMVARMMRAARTSTNGGALNSEEVAESLQRLDAIWEELFPAEQARILRLLVERLEVGTESIDLRLRVEGLHSLVAELRETERTEGTEETAA